MKPMNVKKIALQGLVIFSLAALSTALADGSNPTRPGGGYAETIVINPLLLDGFGFGDGSLAPLPLY